MMKLLINNNNIIISSVVAFFVTYITIPSIIRMANFKELFDKVDSRKVHSSDVPRLGGIGFFSGLIISVLLFVDYSGFECFGGLLAGLFILFLIGLKDDILIIAPLTKFIGQLIATVVIIVFGDVMLTNLHGFFGINEIDPVIGFIITVFVFLVTINAFNFIDGVDGLSATIGVITSSAFGTWFILIEQINYAIIAFSLTAGLFAFLRFNIFANKLKIFMGDTGSMIIGFVVAFLAIQFNQIDLEVVNSDYFIIPAPAFAFGVLIVPYFDMLRVIYIRLIKKQGVFRPDNNHTHHLLMKIGLSHKKVVLVLALYNVIFIFLSYYLSSCLSIRRLLLIQLIIAVFASFIPEFILKKKKKNNKHINLN